MLILQFIGFWGGNMAPEVNYVYLLSADVIFLVVRMKGFFNTETKLQACLTLVLKDS